MRFSTYTNILAAAAVARVAAEDPATGELGDAMVVDDNPAGAVVRATLAPNPFLTVQTPAGGPVVGEVVASTPPDGVGAMFKVNFQNLPTEGGPFSYHIHVDPVAEDGNCGSTLAHLDPYIRGENPVCDPSTPEKCQVGDLAGKHGKVEVDGGAAYQTTFTDDFVAMYEGPGSYFGNRSIVLHFANKTRIACASFKVMNPGIFAPTTSDCPDGDDESATATATATPTAGPANGAANETLTTATMPATATKSGEPAGATGTPVTVSAAGRGFAASAAVSSLVSLAAVAVFFVL